MIRGTVRGRIGRWAATALVAVVMPACATLLGIEDWEGSTAGTAAAGGSAAASSGPSGGGGGDEVGGAGGACPGCAEAVKWASTPGGGADDKGVDVAIDGAGNVYATGICHGPLEIEGTLLPSLGTGDAFVAKYGPGGTLLWAKVFGGANDDIGVRVLPVPAGGVVVIGLTKSASIDFEGTPRSFVGAMAGFAVKLDEVGTVTAVAAVDGPMGNNILMTGGIDGAGSVLLGGYFDGGLTAETGMTYVTLGSTDIFLMKLDTDLVPVWSRRFGGGAAETIYAIDADSHGNWVAVGATTESLDFGPAPLPYGGAVDAFILKLDGNGTTLWSNAYGGSADEGLNAVAIDPEDAVVVGGNTTGTFKIGSDTLESAGDSDAIVAKLTPAGIPVWARSFGGPEDQFCNRVRTDGSGHVWFAGSFRGTLGLATGNLVSSADADAFLIELDPAANALCGMRFGGVGEDTASGLAIGPCGRTVITGWFAESVVFDERRTSAGGVDAFVLDLAP